MNTATNIPKNEFIASGNRPAESASSGISWSAIIGGAFAAAAISLILLMLGSALGLSSVSPWSRHSETVEAFTTKTAIWLIVMQWIAAGIGGYLTGRLRIKWAGVHTDEVFFRDTAHGFLTWAVATVFTASLLASAASSVVSGGVKAATTVAAGAAAGANQGTNQHTDNLADPTGYYVDSLFRTNNISSTGGTTPEVKAETTRIILTDMKNGGVPDVDKQYLTQLVAARTGLNQADASKRVDDVITQLNAAKEKAKQEAETARKAAMHASLYMFLSLLMGAFIGSSAAAIGGRQRDEY